MDFKDSKTYQNLLNAYYYELITSSQYEIYSIQASEETYIEIGKIFTTLARNDLEHARMWLKQLNNGSIPSTEENLSTSIESINKDMYNEYSNVAREEGFDDLAALFNGVANISINHEVILNTQLSDIKRNQVFCKDTEVLWICQACGNIMNGLCAPEICPVCSFPQGYYKLYTCFD
jgi:rubrerythrin